MGTPREHHIKARAAQVHGTALDPHTKPRECNSVSPNLTALFFFSEFFRLFGMYVLQQPGTALAQELLQLL